MDFTGRPMKGYVMVNENGMKTDDEFDYWINLCLNFKLNPRKRKSNIDYTFNKKTKQYEKCDQLV